MLYIVTPCSRPENLQLMSETIPPFAKWFVMVDASVKPDATIREGVIVLSDKSGSHGNPLRNEFLDMMEGLFSDDDWVYVLDDDNVFHPRLAESVEELMKMDCGMITWAQEGRLPATDAPRVGNIDTACYMFKAKAIDGLRFTMDYVADGIFAEEMSKKCKLVKIDEVMCYYNYLRR